MYRKVTGVNYNEDNEEEVKDDVVKEMKYRISKIEEEIEFKVESSYKEGFTDGYRQGDPAEPVGIGQGPVHESVSGALVEIWTGYVDKRNRHGFKKIAGQCEGAFVQGQDKSGKEITECGCRKRSPGPYVL